MKRGEKGTLVVLAISLITIISLSIILSSCIILFSSDAYAFGVSTPYIDNDTLKLEPGQSYVYTINIQNGDDTAYDIEINYSSSSNIAALRERDPHIEAKSYDNPFSFDISVPKEAETGDEYSLVYYAKPIVPQQGQVPMTIEIRRSLRIVVVDSYGQGYKQKWADTLPGWVKDSTSAIVLFYGEAKYYLIILLIIVIVWLLIKRFWGLSRGISLSIIKRRDVDKLDNASTKADLEDKRITNINSLVSFRDILQQLPEEQYDLPEIRRLLSDKLKDLGEEFLSEKILRKDKSAMLRILED